MIRNQCHFIEQERVKVQRHKSKAPNMHLLVYDGNEVIAKCKAIKVLATEIAMNGWLPDTYALRWNHVDTRDPAIFAGHLLCRVLAELQQAGIRHVVVDVFPQHRAVYLPVLESLDFTITRTKCDMELELTPEMADTRPELPPEMPIPEAPGKKTGKQLRPLPFTVQAGDEASVSLTVETVLGTSPAIAPGEKYFVSGTCAVYATPPPVMLQLTFSPEGQRAGYWLLLRRYMGDRKQFFFTATVREETPEQVLNISLVDESEQAVNVARIVLQK
jgi:hypothetical protein